MADIALAVNRNVGAAIQDIILAVKRSFGATMQALGLGRDELIEQNHPRKRVLHPASPPNQKEIFQNREHSSAPKPDLSR